MQKLLWILSYLVLATCAQAQQNPATEIRFRAVLDLTHALGENNPAYEQAAEPPFHAKTVGTIEKNLYFAREICLPEHFGTHLDAPAHFARGQWTVDQIPPERFIAPLVVLDVRSRAAANPDYQLSAADVSAWEKLHAQVPPGSVVVANTGWGSRWSSPEQYRNADRKGVMHFPGYSLAAARLLVEERKVYGLGIDTLSIDYGPSQDFPVHRYTLAHRLYHLENVADLDRLPARGSTVVVAPIKLEGGSGGPVRIFALVP